MTLNRLAASLSPSNVPLTALSISLRCLGLVLPLTAVFLIEVIASRPFLQRSTKSMYGSTNGNLMPWLSSLYLSIHDRVS